ncbi:hypothetical protein ACHAPU_001860 [Fusarium lateritium]
MLSVSALVALAIAGSIDIASASLCKPSSPLQPGTTASTSITTGTATKSVPASETTDGPIIITNAVTNGDFGGYDPSADGGIYAFQAGGDARLLQGPGHQGQTDERNCVQLKTNPGTSKSKRDGIFDNPWIQQQLDDMEPSDYTVRFWYSIVNNAVADTCHIEGFYGSESFGATPYFPVVSDGNTWKEFVDSMAVTTNSGKIRFELVCVNGGFAEVYFDQVFVSNKIGDEWVDGISLFFPTSKHAATVPPVQPSTVLPVDTTAIRSDNTEFSDALATQTSDAQATTDDAKTTDKTTGSAPTTTTSSTPTDVITPSGRHVCAKLGAGAAGRGCGKRPYNSSQGYKRYGESSITKEQCAALCLADTKCQSFEWLSRGSGCANTCNLLAALWADGPTNGGSDSAYAYDRSCIQEDECSEQPAGTVCVNVNADTPAKSCTQLKGKAKACAKPFLTASTKAYCGLSNECRDLCAKYPSCKSYAATFGSCSLYDERSTEVAQEGPELYWFTDMDCHACGEGNAFFNYVPLGQDPANMPRGTCGAQEEKTSSIQAATTAQPAMETTSNMETATSYSQTNDKLSLSTDAPSITAAPPSTTASACPNGVPSPGICSVANPVPSKATCGKQGWPGMSDPYGRGLQDFPNQNSFEDCALVCKLDTQCKAFAFDGTRSGPKCMFSPMDLDESGIDKTTNAPFWSDLKCMACRLCGDEETPATTTTKPVSPPELTCTVVKNNEGCRYKENNEWPIGSNGKAVAGYSCQGNGRVTSEEPFSADISTWPRQGSMDQCAGTCMQLQNCKSSAWNRDTGRCEFFSTSLQVAGYKPREGSNVFYNDNACYDCSGLCSGPDLDSTETESVPFFPQSTVAPTTMVTSTRPTEQPTATEAATSSKGESATTTQKAPESAPTDCAIPSASLNDDVTCGLPGMSGQQAQSARLDNYVIKPVGSLAKCAAICLQRADCQGFAYQKSTTACYPYRVGPAGLGITYSPLASDRFYDRGCFACGS